MADTLKEYLVSIGFKVDEASFRRFQDSMVHASGDIAKLGVEVIGVGVALTAMVEKVASHFNDLYYMSQRTGATVASLDAVGYAAKQVGVSTEAAQGAVENFASALRRNPGMAGLFTTLTGHRPTGNSEVDIRSLVKSQANRPDFIALRNLAPFGMDERTYLQYKNNGKELDEAIADHQKRMRAAGLDADEEAGKFHDFMTVLIRLGDQFGILGTQIAKDWRDPVQGMLGQVQSLAEEFAKLDVSTGGYLGKITGLIAAIGGVELFGKLVAKVFGIAVPSVAAGIPLVAGAGIGIGIAQQIEHKNDTGLPPDEAGVAALPWWRRAAVSVQRNVFGADPNQFTGGRSPVHSTGRVWGDAEATAAGLYDAPGVPLPRARPGGSGVSIQQTNHISGSFKDADEIARRVNDTNRTLGDALRNQAQKIQ